jgi:2-methylcitrate dehydratase PrpD
MGAAAAVGRLLRLDAAAMEEAIGVAASSSSGIFAYLAGGGTVKKFHPGHAAREGVLAAFLVARGAVRGPRGVLEAKAGVLQAFGGLDNWPARAGAPGEPPIVAASYLKPYPCCRHIHPAIDALLALRAEHRLDPEAVERIEVGTYAVAMPHAALPWDGFVTAQLSFPYVMGVALRSGRVELASFDEAARRDAAILRDVAKVRVAVDPECEANYPAQGPARVTLALKDGTRLSAYVPEPLGSPARPLPDAAFAAKLRMMLAGWLDAAAEARALAAFDDPASLPRWRDLHALLAKETK